MVLDHHLSSFRTIHKSAILDHQLRGPTALELYHLSTFIFDDFLQLDHLRHDGTVERHRTAGQMTERDTCDDMETVCTCTNMEDWKMMCIQQECNGHTMGYCMNYKSRWMCSTMGDLAPFHGHCMMVKLIFAVKGLLIFLGCPIFQKTNMELQASSRCFEHRFILFNFLSFWYPFLYFWVPAHIPTVFFCRGVTSLTD